MPQRSGCLHHSNSPRPLQNFCVFILYQWSRQKHCKDFPMIWDVHIWASCSDHHLPGHTMWSRVRIIRKYGCWSGKQAPSSSLLPLWSWDIQVPACTCSCLPGPCHSQSPWVRIGSGVRGTYATLIAMTNRHMEHVQVHPPAPTSTVRMLYLMDPKVGIGVEVIISRGHLLRV